LTLKPYKDYPRYDQTAVPVTATEHRSRLRLHRSGKAAFWQDGTANLFAQRAQHMQRLRQDPGPAELQQPKAMLGSTPR
ncbi:hypothetical protein ABFV45_27450, partial [Pseudomonas urmiensis]